jgi:hypothetical protein
MPVGLSLGLQLFCISIIRRLCIKRISGNPRSGAQNRRALALANVFLQASELLTLVLLSDSPFLFEVLAVLAHEDFTTVIRALVPAQLLSFVDYTVSFAFLIYCVWYWSVIKASNIIIFAASLISSKSPSMTCA